MHEDMDLGLCFAVHSSIRVWICYFPLSHVNSSVCSWPGSPNPQLCATPAWTTSLTCVCTSCSPSLPPACCAVYRASLGCGKDPGRGSVPCVNPGCGKLLGFFECTGLDRVCLSQSAMSWHRAWPLQHLCPGGGETCCAHPAEPIDAQDSS